MCELKKNIIEYGAHVLICSIIINSNWLNNYKLNK